MNDSQKDHSRFVLLRVSVIEPNENRFQSNSAHSQLKGDAR